MGIAADDASRWLPAARTGSSDALGSALEACRGYLLLIAQRELDPRLQAKGGASDLVQQTLLDAVGAFGQFHGQTEAEFIGWLRRILLNNLFSFTRLYRDTAKRQLSCEASWQDNRLNGIPDGMPSPSELVSGDEQDRALRAALQMLPDDYRKVLLLRHQENRTFEEIGNLMDRSSGAARKLWLRALEHLQQEFAV